jgi:hypothetical protein
MSDLDKSSIPSIDFNNDTVLAYFLEQLEQENKYKTKKIGVSNTLTIFLNIEFVAGPLDVVTSPYLIYPFQKRHINKTGIFEIIEEIKNLADYINLKILKTSK